ncbi:Putative Zn-dependent protease, contains TPR repeats [Janthinobacterium lividum]|nr:Putative Zn-dependent protease, contains TPR repeats [Janthinobacterium lividum]
MPFGQFVMIGRDRLRTRSYNSSTLSAKLSPHEISMAVTKDLATPDTEDDFEAMCHQLYRQMWNDSTSMRVGRSGHRQFGVDVLAFDGRRTVGIQCKHYVKTKFTYGTVLDDVSKADAEGLVVGHLLFATTAPNNSEIVRTVFELSNSRRSQGKFTVSVDFWSDICGHIRMHPAIGRNFIPGYPGGAILEIGETTAQTLAAVHRVESLLKLALPLGAKGTEADTRVAKVLDLVRDKIREGKTVDARELLDNLGDPTVFQDDFSRFRWFTNQAAVDLANGQRKLAAKNCLRAFELAPDHEVANFNRVRAYLLLDDLPAAASSFEQALSLFPKSPTLWSLKININEKQGMSSPLEGIPDCVRESREVLLMRAELHHNHEQHEEAIALLKQTIALEPDLTETKRVYLAEALSWAAKDAVQAYYRHLTSEKKLALSDALKHFEPLEKTLTSIQSDSISFEITSNVSAALMLLGHKERAHTIVALCLARHPLSEGLLRIRLSQLAEQDDLASVKNLTDFRLNELHPVLLAQLAEMSADAGDLTWYGAVMEVVDIKISEDVRLEELHALKFKAMAVAGKLDEALDSARIYATEHPDQIIAQVVVTEILERKGEKNLARKAALESLSQIQDDTTSANVLQVAELLYKFQHFSEAAPLYERLVTNPGADSLTWKLMVCLLKGDKRAKVKTILDQINPVVREEPEIRQIECDLAWRAGDWRRMRNILQLGLEENTESSDVALGYVGALYQLSDETTLHSFLSKDTVFKPIILDNEYEYAKHQVSRGLEGLAMRRMYRVYRGNSSDTRIASHYIAISLMCKQLSKLLNASSAGPGTAIELCHGSERWWVAIDLYDSKEVGGGWPELISDGSDIFRALVGHEIGDEVFINRGLIQQECKIISIISIVAFAIKKAHAHIAASPTPQGPVFTLSIPTLIDTVSISELDKKQALHVAQNSNNWQAYREICLPFCMLASISNTDPVALLFDWKHHQTPLAVHSGTSHEREQERKILKEFRQRYVLDLLTLTELVRSNVLQKTIDFLGTPLVPSSVREQVLQLLHAEKTIHTAYTPKTVIPAPKGILDRYAGKYFSLLNAILYALDNYCDVPPTYGPSEVTTSLEEIFTMLDRSTSDVLRLCLERNAVFITEDFNLRVSARENAIVTIGTQAILIKMKESFLLSSTQYSNIIGRKVFDNHWFINVSSEDLVQWARLSKTMVNSMACIALENFNHKNFEFTSGYKVCCEFLTQATRELPPNVVAAYTNLIYKVLAEGKSHSTEIYLITGLGRLLQHVYGKGGKKLPRSSRKSFGKFLTKNY